MPKLRAYEQSGGSHTSVASNVTVLFSGQSFQRSSTEPPSSATSPFQLSCAVLLSSPKSTSANTRSQECRIAVSGRLMRRTSPVGVYTEGSGGAWCGLRTASCLRLQCRVGLCASHHAIGNSLRGRRNAVRKFDSGFRGSAWTRTETRALRTWQHSLLYSTPSPAPANYPQPSWSSGAPAPPLRSSKKPTPCPAANHPTPAPSAWVSRDGEWAGGPTSPNTSQGGGPPPPEG